MMEHSGVRLRALEHSDIPALWELHTPAIFEHMLTKVQSFDEMKTWLGVGIGRSDVLGFAVEDMDTGKIIGTTRIAMIDHKNKSCEIGSTFYAESVQRSHVNTAVKTMLLAHCFEDMDMIRVQFKTDAENHRSQQALERLGAVKEGVIRNERIRSTGKPRDAVLYSIIDSEWPEAKKRLIEKMNKYT
jgi:RimJ/RimL family protein N-acetyltransferase